MTTPKDTNDRNRRTPWSTALRSCAKATRTPVVVGLLLAASVVALGGFVAGDTVRGATRRTPTPTPTSTPTSTPTDPPTATPTHTPVPDTPTPEPPAPPPPPAPPTQPAPPPAPNPAPPPVVGRPAWSPDVMRQPLRRGDTGRPVVYLTFDDGWGHPDAILAILQEKGVRATACLVGTFMEQHPDFVRRWAASGNTFCNHSWNHDDLTRLPLLFGAPGSLPENLTRTEELLARIAPGHSMRPFMRPPFGSLNAEVASAAAELGYRPILWSLDPQDWRPGVDPNALRNHVVSNATNGDIILLHFTRYSTVQALPGIIDGLRARGFSIEGLETLPNW
jgi:peptidoglycan-N-acetylglucosamine deacetylase